MGASGLRRFALATIETLRGGTTPVTRVWLLVQRGGFRLGKIDTWTDKKKMLTMKRKKPRKFLTPPTRLRAHLTHET
jgi:hypothetical protein